MLKRLLCGCIVCVLLLTGFISQAQPQGSTMWDPIEVGSLDCQSTVYNLNTYPSSGYGDDYGNSTDDIFLRFTLSTTKDVLLNTCNSEAVGTQIYLLNAAGGLIETVTSTPEIIAEGCEFGSLLRRRLPAGTYYYVVEAVEGDPYGFINAFMEAFKPDGSTLANAIDVGTLTCNGFATSVNNNPSNCYTNDYGNSTDDIYFKFSVSEATQVQVSTCNPEAVNTTIYLLNSSGSLIASNTTNVPVCTEFGSSLSQQLSPGNYYVVVEGVPEDPFGWINVHIDKFAPQTPSPIQVSNLVGTSFTLNWPTVPGATSYYLDVSRDFDFSSFVDGFQNKPVSGTSQVVSGLSEGTQYYYRLRASNGLCASPSSQSASVRTKYNAPVAQTPVQIYNNGFLPRWTHCCIGEDFLSYEVQVSENPSFNPLVATNSGGTFTNLKAGTTYYYRVRVFWWSEYQSDYSNVVSVLTLPGTPVAAPPSNLSDGSFIAPWTGAGAAQYLLDVSTTSNFSNFVPGYHDLVISATASSKLVTGLQSNTIYYYRVRGTNASGTTPYSNTMSVIRAPVALSPQGNNLYAYGFRASWLSTGESPSVQLSYEVQVSDNPLFGGCYSESGCTYEAATESLYIGNDIIPGNIYYYRVRAFTGAGLGFSDYSNVVTVQTLPTAPTVIGATAVSDESFQANWYTNARGATTYRLEVATNSSFTNHVPGYENMLVSGEDMIVMTLPGIDIYYYRVWVENPAGRVASEVMSVLLLRSWITSPNGGEAFPLGSDIPVSYNTELNNPPNVGVELYRNSSGGLTKVFPTGSSPWYGITIPTNGLPTGSYKIRVYEIEHTLREDFSNDFFQIVEDQNYVRTTHILQDQISDPANIAIIDIGQKAVVTNFFDGLGRPVQSVITKGSPDKKDIVQSKTYDEFGRESVKYLPYVSPTSHGWYKSDAISEQLTFYGNTPKVATDSHPFAVTVFEPSPLDRIVKQGAPGVAWQPDEENSYTSTDHTLKKDYDFNAAGEVLLWTYTYPTATYPLGLVNAGTASAPAYYEPNELFKNKSKDEHQNEVIEYFDKKGRVILKRVLVIERTPVNDVNYASTYYVYDDFDNLVTVIPPEASKRISKSPSEYLDKTGTEKDDFLNRWAFRYSYDNRKRMTQKLLPGASVVYMVYDNYDRVVLTQDGNQRSASTKFWTFTKYDQLNRAIATGIKDTSTLLTQAQMQAAVDAYYAKPWTRLYESYVGNITGNIHGYSNRSYPVVTTGAATDPDRYLTVSYYDNYSFRDSWNTGFNYLDEGLSGVHNDVVYTQPDSEWLAVKGQLAGTKARVLDAPVQWLKTVSYYDDKYRVLQTISDNIKGTTDRTTNLYDFAGKILKTRTRHGSYNITRTFNYDHAGRLLETWHSIDGAAPVLLVQNEYNALGQLVTKNLHKAGESEFVTADPAVGQPGVVYDSEINSSSYNSAQHTYIATGQIHLTPGFWVQEGNVLTARIGYSQQDAARHNSELAASMNYKQIVNYRYNIRGWLTRINNSDLSITEDGPRDYFGMNLFYNDPVAALGNQPAFNGNISAMQWSTNLGLGTGLPEMGVPQPKERAYTFSYDTLNRLKSAQHHILTGSWNNSSAFYEGNLKYDINGNIRKLDRTATSGSAIDQLSYAYSGNQLLKVSDASGVEGFSDGTNLDNDYAYDANGNMILDQNKSVNAISYNHLNLPDLVRKSTGEYIKYIYDATGRKLSQRVFNSGNSPQKKTDYIGDFFYENDTLKFINHEEGRVVMTGVAPEYQYHLKDHLGNARLTFTTKQEADDAKATLETANASAEQGKFLYYNEAVKVNTPLFDHTNQGATAYATRLLGGNTNEVYGLAKSLSVMPGDMINIEVFAKYIDRNESNGWTTALQNLMAAIAAGTAPSGTLVDGGAPGSNGVPFPGSLGKGSETGTAPKAYLNYVVFDRDFNPILSESGFKRITTAAKENGSDIAHERLFKDNLIIRQPGYVYIYLSNENETPVEVFFDDLRIEHVKSAVVQMDDYYPFGLTFNSYQREHSMKQGYLYNGKELQEELGLNWFDYGSRMYMADIGRWGVVDPLAPFFPSISGYNYVWNNPMNYIDKDGEIPIPIITGLIGAAGGAIYGLATGKSWKQVGALAAGGFVAGATLGFGTAAIGLAGGATTLATATTANVAAGATYLGAANYAYISIASGVVGNMAGEFVQQGLDISSGEQDKWDKGDIVLNGIFGLAEPVLGPVTDMLGNPVKNIAKEQATEALTFTFKSEAAYKSDLIKKLQQASAGTMTKKEASLAAEKLINLAKETNKTVLDATIKVSDGAVDVSLNAVTTNTTEKIEDDF